MQKRHLWLVLVVALGVALGYWWSRRSDHATSLPAPAATTQHPASPARPSGATPTAIPAPSPAASPVARSIATPAITSPPASATTAASAVTAVSEPKPDVAIEENKTIDFSGGKAVVKNSAEEKAIIDAAVKEMDEATKNITFAPLAAKPADAKKAELKEAPPK